MDVYTTTVRVQYLRRAGRLTWAKNRKLMRYLTSAFRHSLDPNFLTTLQQWRPPLNDKVPSEMNKMALSTLR